MSNVNFSSSWTDALRRVKNQTQINLTCVPLSTHCTEPRMFVAVPVGTTIKTHTAMQPKEELEAHCGTNDPAHPRYNDCNCTVAGGVKEPPGSDSMRYVSEGRKAGTGTKGRKRDRETERQRVREADRQLERDKISHAAATHAHKRAYARTVSFVRLGAVFCLLSSVF